MTLSIRQTFRLFLLLTLLPLYPALSQAQTCYDYFTKEVQPIPHVTRRGMHHLRPIASYNEVLRALQADPYDYNNLPVIPIINFNFRTGKWEVGNRSRDILLERSVLLSEYRRKPIHPMGIPIAGKMVFYEGSNPYSGVFRGGEFDVLARFSLSQGNPFRFETRTARQIARNLPATPQVRSMTMGILLFDPNIAQNETSPIVSLMLQDDLNGVVNPNTGDANYFLEQTLLNKPDFAPGKLLTEEARLYHFGTLAGVFRGAVTNPFERTKADGHDIKSTTLGVDPLLRPPHGFANFRETDVDQINSPVWLKVVPINKQPVERRDDLRQEIYESLQRHGARHYAIYAAHEVNSLTLQKQWIQVGHFAVEEAFLPSQGTDMGVTFPHADVTNINYATGISAYDNIRSSNPRQHNNIALQ